MKTLRKASLGSNFTGSYKTSVFRSLSVIYNEALQWARDVFKTSVLGFLKTLGHGM